MRERVSVMDGFTSQTVSMRPPKPIVTGGGLRAGIDPGKTGWVVVERADSTLRGWQIPVIEEKKRGAKRKSTRYDRSGIIAIVHKMKAMGVTHVTLEAQQPTRLRGSQGDAANNAVRASFMTGYGFALWEMALDMADIKFDLAWPSAWKKKMGISAPSDVKDQKQREKLAKANAVAAAAKEWPDHDFRRTPRCNPSHDQSEAALLIRYGELKCVS